MALRLIRVRDFQSIKEASIDVGRLTVVVGESNVGKSALVRAIRLLARNGASTGLVRKGADSTAVAALFEDGTAVQVRRGARLSEYKVRKGEDLQTYTKCATGVPEEITKYLSLASTDLGELSFAGQHDPPFLLSQPASSVARQIGAITNAHLLNDAVRETNRRRLEYAQEVRSFTREADECREQLAGASALKVRKAALGRCQEALGAAEAAEAKRAALAGVVAYAEQLQREIGALEAVSAPTGKLEGLISDASVWANQLTAVRELVRRYLSVEGEIKQEESVSREWAHGAQQIEEDAHRMLAEAGVCPACGQEVMAK